MVYLLLIESINVNKFFLYDFNLSLFNSIIISSSVVLFYSVVIELHILPFSKSFSNRILNIFDAINFTDLFSILFSRCLIKFSLFLYSMYG